MNRRANRQRANRRQRQRYKTIVVPVGSLNPEVDNVIRLPEHLKHQPVLVLQQKQTGQGPLQAAQPPILPLPQQPLQLAQPPSQAFQPPTQAAPAPLSKRPFEPVVLPQIYQSNFPQPLARRGDKEPQSKALTVKYRREDPDKSDSDDEEESATEEEEEGEEEEQEEEEDSGKVVRTPSKGKGLRKNESILCACSSSGLSQNSCISCRTSSRLNMSQNSCLSCNSIGFGYNLPRNRMPSSKPIYGILEPGRRRSKPLLPKAPFDASRSILYSTPAARPPPSIVHPISNVLAQASQRPLYYRNPVPNREPSCIRPVTPQSFLFSRQPSYSHHRCNDCDSRKLG